MKLVFATHNQNKFKEVVAMMPKHIELLSLTDIGCHDDIPETAETIEGNAMLKAQFVKENYGFDCFADDTGLEVKALHGAPGVHSARYDGPKKNADANMTKLLNALVSLDRTAQFKTVIALIQGTDEKAFTGICEGRITFERRGTDGFGYDPIFQPKGHNQTFAQMSLSEKSEIGHRGKAMRQLIEWLRESN